MPKTDSVMMKKIKSSIRVYKTSNETNPEYKKFLDKGKQIQNWVFELLKHKNIIINDQTDGGKILINTDQMHEYRSSIKNNSEISKEELLNMSFLQN